MSLPKLGHAVIINNIETEMPGSKVDAAALKEAYETIGFNVQIHSDCTSQVSTSQSLVLKRWTQVISK